MTAERVAWDLEPLSSDELKQTQRLLETPPGEQLAGIIGTAMTRRLTGEEAVAALVLLAQVREQAA